MEKIKMVPIQLDRERHLLYDVNALIDLGDALDLNLLTSDGWKELVGRNEINQATGEEVFVAAMPTLRKVRAILWAGLRHEDPKLTEREVGAMIGLTTDLTAVIEAYQKAWATQGVLENKTPGDDAGPLAASGNAAAAN